MEEPKHRSRHFDTQAFLYRSITHILIIIGIGILVKFTFVDAIKMSGGQMNPTILSGDMLLVFRTPYLSISSTLMKPGLKKPVLFRVPSDNKSIGCLRIAGFSNDTVSIDSGRYSNSRGPEIDFPSQGKRDLVLPENFSPRDYFRSFRIPAPNDTLLIDSLPIRELFFSVSIMRQENPDQSIQIKPLLRIDDSLASDYIIRGFTLFNGSIDSVPQEIGDSWFFWSRLEHYLKQTNPNRAISLSFSVLTDDSRVHHYIVKNDYVFLMADNWNGGLDSRYFGPVKSSNIIGRVFSVLWSYEKESGKKGHIRINRLGRIIT